MDSIQDMIEMFVLRRKSVSLNTIQKRFCAYPASFVSTQVDLAVQDGKISMRRNGLSRRAGYVYEAVRAIESTASN